MRKKKLLSDIFLILLSLLLYVILRVSFGRSLLYIIVVPALALAIHTFAMSYFDKKFAKIKASEEYEIQRRFKNSEDNLSTYMTQLQKLSDDNPEFHDVVVLFMRSFYSLSAKQKVLNTLVEMNDDKAKRFLDERNKATQDFILANAKKLLKSLIVYNAQAERNRPKTIAEVNSVREVLESTKDLVDKFDLLLEEVKRMGDDFNPEDPGLLDAIENLQQLRTSRDEAVDDEDDEDVGIHLTLNPSDSKRKKDFEVRGGT